MKKLKRSFSFNPTARKFTTNSTGNFPVNDTTPDESAWEEIILYVEEI